jgi:hypothetical protein
MPEEATCRVINDVREGKFNIIDKIKPMLDDIRRHNLQTQLSQALLRRASQEITKKC